MVFYVSGEAVRIGHSVDLGGDQNGIVVGIIQQHEYADGYRDEDWRHLGHGLVVSTGFGDLRVGEPDEDLELVARLDQRGEIPSVGRAQR